MAKTKKNLTEWGDGKSILLDLAIQQAVGLVDPILDVMRAIRGKPSTLLVQRYVDELLSYPGNETWTVYYHNQDKLFWDFCQAVLSDMRIHNDKIPITLSLIFGMICRVEIADGIATIAKSIDSVEVEENYRQAAESLNPLLYAFSESFSRQIAGEDDPEPVGGVLSFIQHPAVKFMILVFVPCAASFQTTPAILLKSATEGSEQALERLLTIDKHALMVQGIDTIFHDRSTVDPKRFQVTIPKYLAKSPPVIVRKQLKQALSTLLYVLMDSIEAQLCSLGNDELATRAREINTLTMPEIQSAFTAFLRDSGKIARHEHDADVADNDAFRQAIHRMRKNLPPLPGQ